MRPMIERGSGVPGHGSVGVSECRGALRRSTISTYVLRFTFYSSGHVSRFTFRDTIQRPARAFTLIELLVVIAIMMILAGLLIPIGGAVKRQRILSKTKAELKLFDAAIEAFKQKYGTYPPDNPNNLNENPLYYELVGTTANGNTFTTKDGNATIDSATATTQFGLGGFINCTKGAGSDEGTTAKNFLPGGLKPNQLAETNGVKVLVASVGLAPGTPPNTPNPWHYVMRSPTNNVKSFDLWVDVLVGSKTNRVANWSDRPI
jgi:prepilin-type N-terminal cleavage/methylation domain-containing protein